MMRAFTTPLLNPRNIVIRVDGISAKPRAAIRGDGVLFGVWCGEFRFPGQYPDEIEAIAAAARFFDRLTPAEAWRMELVFLLHRRLPHVDPYLIEFTDGEVARCLETGMTPGQVLDEVAEEIVALHEKAESRTTESTCRVCGCTDSQACPDDGTGQSCCWVELDLATGAGLCSACVDKDSAGGAP
jgi:hypothetical protein